MLILTGFAHLIDQVQQFVLLEMFNLTGIGLNLLSLLQDRLLFPLFIAVLIDILLVHAGICHSVVNFEQSLHIPNDNFQKVEAKSVLFIFCEFIQKYHIFLMHKRYVFEVEQERSILKHPAQEEVAIE